MISWQLPMVASIHTTLLTFPSLTDQRTWDYPKNGLPHLSCKIALCTLSYPKYSELNCQNLILTYFSPAKWNSFCNKPPPSTLAVGTVQIHTQLWKYSRNIMTVSQSQYLKVIPCLDLAQFPGIYPHSSVYPIHRWPRLGSEGSSYALHSGKTHHMGTPWAAHWTGSIPRRGRKEVWQKAGNMAWEGSCPTAFSIFPLTKSSSLLDAS